MAESITAAASPTQNVPPPRPPPPKFSSAKTTEDLISTKPRKPRARKFHSVHGRATGDKVVPQRKVSLQEKLEEKVTLETTPSGGANSTVIHIDEVDHAVSSKSPSKSPRRDVEERASPVDGNKPVENGEDDALTTAESVKPVTQPQPNTNSSTSKDTLQSNIPTGSSKRYRSVSVEDDIALLSKSSAAASEEVMTKPRSKTLPRNLGTRQPSADGVSNKKKPAKKTPPPPIPTRPPVVMQYQNKNSDGSTSQFRRSQSNSVSSHSSTPSIPEETTAPPLTSQITPPSSPRVIPPSPDLCTPEIKQPEQVEDTNKPHGHHNDDVFEEASSKPELSPTSKGRKKLLSGFKNTFRRRPKSAAEEKEKSMTLGTVGSGQPIVVAHRRVKSVKEEVARDQSLPGGVIPPIVVQCVAYLNRPMCLNEEGLFRIPGDMSQIRRLRDGFIAGKEMDLSEILEPHNVAGLLKLHYREMKLCLIPRGEMSREITRAAKARDVDAVKDILSQIPSENLALIRVVVELLKQVTDYSGKNQMTSGNLGASCGLSIFPSLQAGNASALLKCLVDHIETIFPE